MEKVLYISKRKYDIPYNLTLVFLRHAVLPYTSVVSLEESDLDSIEAQLKKRSLKPSDAIHLASMKKLGISNIVSEDKEFDTTKGIKRVWLGAL